MAVVLIVGSLLLSFVPCLLLYFWLKKGMDDPVRRDMCRKLLKGGALCSFGVLACSGILVLIRLILGHTVLPVLVENDLVGAVYHNFLVLAFSEELVKGLTAWRITKRNIENPSWLDLIVFTGMVGIGFEMLESLVYVIESNPIQILVRGITALHVVYGMTMGYFLGRGLRTGSKVSLACALLVPVLLHGLYDFSLSDEFLAVGDISVFLPFIMIFVTLVIGVCIILLVRRVHRQQDEKYLAPLPLVR